jgi:hypothetical protein
MMRNYLVILSLLLTGCATKTALTPIHYQFLDNPAERRVELIYQNTSRDSMCLLPEHWPNLAGKINQASDRVQLVVNHQRFPVEAFNTGYCPQGCALRVAPGEKAAAFISYQDFKLPDQLVSEPKTLEFEPLAYKCPKK